MMMISNLRPMMAPSFLADDDDDDDLKSEVFSTREVMLNWVRMIGRQNGIVLVIGKSAKAIGNNAPRCTIICEKGGKYRRSQYLEDGQPLQRKTGSNKSNCKFVLRGLPYRTSNGFVWDVQVIYDFHNHEPAEQFEGHEYPSRFKEAEKEFVIDMANNTAPRFLLNVLKKRDKSYTTGIKSMYNIIATNKEAKRGGLSVIQYALSELTSKGYHYDFLTNPNTNEITDIIWAHPQCLELYVIFPTVLVMDATNKTNEYRLPLLEIVGITSTLKIFSLMFAYLSNEKKERVIWALNTLKNWMHAKRAIMPSVIVSDRDLALVGAIDACFPMARHILCIWHINQNILKNCSPMLGPEFKSFLASWHKLYMSSTEADYDRRWNILCTVYGHHSPVIEYLESTWMRYKERFVAAWVNTYMHFGSTSSQRVESAHAMLKRHLGGDTMSSLETSVLKIDDMLKMQIGTIKESFEMSINKPRHTHVEEPLYAAIRCHVSLHALDFIDCHLQCIHDASPNLFGHCDCIIKMTHELPCMHDLAYYRHHSIPIPLSDINTHWKRLSIHAEPRADIEEIVPNQQDHSTLRAPAYNTTHRGRPAGRNEQNPRRIRSCLEGSKMRSSVRNTKRKSDPFRPYIDSLPEPLRDYITHIVNVVGDGNCGFRAIAAQVGYGEHGWLQVRIDLIEEL